MINVKNYSKISENLGFCLNIDDVDSCLAKYQLKTHTKFSVVQQDEDFGKIDVLAKKRTLLWSNENCTEMKDEVMPFDGIPYFVLGKKVYRCKLGKRKVQKRKTSGRIFKPSIMQRCPAKLSVFEILKFPEHMIDSDDQENRSDLIKKLTTDLGIGKALAERRFYIFFPKFCDHRYHLLIKDGKFVQSPFVDDESNDESESSDVDVCNNTNSVVNTAQDCCDLLQQLKEKTYTCDDMTLAYGRILLKDTLQRLRYVKEHGMFNATTSNR